MTFGSVFTNILGFFPYVLQGVIAVEQSVKTVPGETKKQLVLSAVQTAAQVGEEIPVPVVQGISALIDNIVTALNNSGVFTHSTPAPAPVAAAPAG